MPSPGERFSHAFPFIFPWAILLAIYVIWEIITLYHIKNHVSPVESEAIISRLDAVKSSFYKVVKILFIVIAGLALLAFTFTSPFLAIPVFIFLIVIVKSVKKDLTIWSLIKIFAKIFLYFLCSTPFLVILGNLFPFALVLLFGTIVFIKAIIFIFKMPSISFYSLKGRYIIMHIIILVLMAVSYHMSVYYIAG